MLVGYARTSTVEQVAGLEAQETALAATGCTKVFREQASSVGQRGQLDAVLDFVREGDTLVVSRLDRLARSTADLLGIVALLEGKQVGLRVLDFGGSEVDTRSPTGRMLLTMFAAARSGRVAWIQRTRRARQHHAHAPAATLPRAQSGRKCLAVHARQLALQPHLLIP